mmetsp:Transcript_41088/g.132162  ORF Transcript_41088/g.132162 Transcript_41088/m.132162 type:complete len:86 (-) Transcript_41088:1119-1376(-)
MCGSSNTSDLQDLSASTYTTSSASSSEDHVSALMRSTDFNRFKNLAASIVDMVVYTPPCDPSFKHPGVFPAKHRPVSAKPNAVKR